MLYISALFFNFSISCKTNFNDYIADIKNKIKKMEILNLVLSFIEQNIAVSIVVLFCLSGTLGAFILLRKLEKIQKSEWIHLDFFYF